ncbi:hypothetical protein SAMN06295967_12123 [Belliella buryatensis]|uniref:Uncharacterized protein n=1 Tax=Belliella buryatensis TaxID=1500549 RepID=A0A239H0U0_9BACT|nr:hypothetical protein SAMN06295967_12123 [Belliella buryatensis]
MLDILFSNTSSKEENFIVNLNQIVMMKRTNFSAFRPSNTAHDAFKKSKFNLLI